jgi:aconitate hydratase
MYLGVKAVFAKSIERIHAANLVNFGIIPFSFDDESDYDSLPENAEIRIPGIRKALMKGDDSVAAFYKTRRLGLKLNLSRRQRDILLAGGLLPYTVQRRKENRSAA